MATKHAELSEENALAVLTNGTEKTARTAFEHLCHLARPRLEKYLWRLGGVRHAGKADDILQGVFLRTWSVRATLDFPNTAAWHSFLRQATYRGFLDALRAETRLPQHTDYEMEEIPDEDRSLIDVTLLAEAAEVLEDIVDAALLHLAPEGIPRMNRRRLLAAQLYYLDGEPLSRIPRLLGPPFPTRAELDTWLLDPSVLRHVAYSALYFSKPRLALQLLEVNYSKDSREKKEEAQLFQEIVLEICRNAMTRPDAPCGRWTWAEALVLIWHYGYGLSYEQIQARTDCPFLPEVLLPLAERFKGDLPFHEYMCVFLKQVSETEVGDILGRQGILRPLGEAGLWHRLAFTYRYCDDLPQKAVLERIESPAALVGRSITSGALTMWLSGGRLLSQVARCAEQYQRWAGKDGESLDA